MPLFEGAKAYAFELRRGLFDHLSSDIKKAVPQGFAGNIVGWYENVRIRVVKDANGETRKALVARFHITENAAWLRSLMREAFEHGHTDLLGFSIDAQGATSSMIFKGKGVRRVDTIDRVESVDVVTSPAAGGRAVRLVASTSFGGGSMQEATKLGNTIRSLMEKKELKILDLAKAAGVSPATMSSILSGDIERPPDRRLRGLADILGVSFKHLLDQIPAAKRESVDGAMTEGDILDAVVEGFPKLCEGFDGLKDASEEDAPKLLNSLLESNIEKLRDEREQEDDSEKLQEIALKEAGLMAVMRLLQAGKVEDAMALIQKLMAAGKNGSGNYGQPPDRRQTEKANKDKKEREAKNMEEHEKKLKEAEEKAAKAEQEAADAKKALKEKEDAIAIKESQLKVKELLAESGLAKAAMARLGKFLEGRIVTEEEVKKAIDEEREYVAALSESGKVRGCGTVTVGTDDHEKFILGLDGMFENENLKTKEGVVIKKFSGLREAYARLMNDGWADPADVLRESSGYVNQEGRESRQYKRLVESGTTSTWAEILGDSITRKMLREYSLPELNTWKAIVSDITNIKDFRTNRRLRLGGYGTLATVAEQGTYPTLTTPGDEEATYAIAKRGGIEDLTIEMIANDDVGVIRRIPTKLARAAAQTLYRAVWDLLNNNSNVFDSVALANAAHGSNISTTALDSDEVDVARRVMREQTAFGDAVETLGEMNLPGYLIVPPELEKLGTQIATSNIEINASPAAGDRDRPNIHQGLKVIVVSYWTDANNYWLVADPKKIPTIEVGFWQGREEPELFVQDQQTVGSVFNADKISYKIRHIWGQAVLDWRGFFGGIVA